MSANAEDIYADLAAHAASPEVDENDPYGDLTAHSLNTDPHAGMSHTGTAP